RRRRRARPRARPPEVAALAADLAARVRGHRDRVHRPRAEPVVFRAVGVPAPPDRLDLRHRGARAARARGASAFRRAPGVHGADHRVGLGHALHRSRRRAGVRPPLAARRDAAPMRRTLLVVLVALVFPATASAHATLQSTVPPFGHELQRGPVRIVLHFDQHVNVLPGSIKVLNGVGKQFASDARTDGTNVVARVAPLKLGTYTVRWRAISADSHVVSGVWTFGVRVPAPAVADAYGAGGPTTTEHVVRWIWFLGLALAIGSLGFRVFCL